MPAILLSDGKLVEMVKRQFEISADAGWDAWNALPHRASVSQTGRVRERLIELQVVYRCPRCAGGLNEHLSTEPMTYVDCCLAQLNDEPSEADDREDDEECAGGCGQPAYACTCAELASWKRYLATPMEERCGPWTA